MALFLIVKALQMKLANFFMIAKLSFELQAKVTTMNDEINFLRDEIKQKNYILRYLINQVNLNSTLNSSSSTDESVMVNDDDRSVFLENLMADSIVTDYILPVENEERRDNRDNTSQGNEDD